MCMRGNVQAVAFIDASSGATSAAGTNTNLYYVNCFSSSVSTSTGTFLTNANRRVSTAVEQLAYAAGLTNIAAGLDDLALQFRSVSVTVSAIACVVTAGSSPRASVVAAGARLASSVAGGVSISAVAVGDGAAVQTLTAIASSSVTGVPLVFQPTVFTRISLLLTATFISVGALPRITTQQSEPVEIEIAVFASRTLRLDARHCRVRQCSVMQ